jgi:Domain of unknown function (DUF4440)
MNRSSFPAKTIALCCSILLVPLLFLLRPIHAQTPASKTIEHNNVQLELVHTETGFFEAWKMKDEAYFRAHMPEDGIFWGESGTFSRDQQLQQQQAAAKVCNVEGYGLSGFGVLPLTAGVYLLTYQAEQYATCNGEKLPVHMNGSSIYVFKGGQWQAIYRAEVPQKNQS